MEQWAIIDSEYLESDGKTDLKGISILILITILLTIKRYYGNPRTFSVVFSNIAPDWQFPDILPHLYGVFSSIVLFFIIPAIFTHFFLPGGIKDHGFSVKGFSKYIRIYLILLIIVIPLVIVASRFPSFLAKYPLYSQARSSLLEFIIWELAYGVYFVALEFFLRGFMIFALARYLGSYAIFVMVIPYVMIHFGKPVAETFGSIFAGIALGTLALRTRSIFGGVFIHVLVAWSMDILAVIL